MNYYKIPIHSSGLLNALATGKACAVLIPVPDKTERYAVSQGFNHPYVARARRGVYEIDVVASRKDGEKPVILCELPNLGQWLPLVARFREQLDSIREVEESMFSEPDKVHKFSENFERNMNMVYMDKLKEKDPLVKAMFAPFYICLMNPVISKVRDVTLEQMRMEGLRLISSWAEPLEMGKTFTFGDPVNGQSVWYGFNDCPSCTRFLKGKTPEEAYRKFICATYGKAVWEQNATVVRLDAVTRLMFLADTTGREDAITERFIRNMLHPYLAVSAQRTVCGIQNRELSLSEGFAIALGRADDEVLSVGYDEHDKPRVILKDKDAAAQLLTDFITKEIAEGRNDALDMLYTVCVSVLATDGSGNFSKHYCDHVLSAVNSQLETVKKKKDNLTN